MTCGKCGNPIHISDSFCGKCGNPVNNNSPAGHSAAAIVEPNLDYRTYSPPPRPSDGSGLRKAANAYNIFMLSIYGVAILACFICNLAIENRLSWFYIVLSGVGLAFCITNVPVLAGKHKLLTTAFFSSIMLFAVLHSCAWYVGGNWLYSLAYPIAGISLAYFWSIVICLSIRALNWPVRAGLTVLLMGFAAVTINPMIDNILIGGMSSIRDYINPEIWSLSIAGNNISYKMSFIGCVCIAAVLLFIGIAKGITNKNRRK